MFAACSSSKKSPKQQPKQVQFTEEEKLDYDHDFIEATKLKMFGNLPDAANMLTRCTDVNPYDAAAYFQLAEIYSMSDDQANALRYARLAARYDRKNEWYKIQLANLYVAEKNIDSAIVVYRQIIETQPNNADLRYNLAILYLEKNEYRKALKELDKIEKTYGFTEDMAIAKYRIYSRKRDVKATEAVLAKGIRMYPDELRFYGLLAELYSSTGREREAQENYTRLLEVDPENALGYISMIEFYKDYGNDTKAMEEMQRMYDLKTIDPDLKVELYLQLSSDSVFFKKHYKQMDVLVKQLYEKYPDNFRVRLVNADRNLRGKNFEGAKNDLLFITDRVQTNYFLWEQLFYLLNLLQDNETLYESTGKALKYFDDRYLFNFFHGLSASMLKKYDGAILACLRTLECLKKEKNPDRDVELQTLVFLGEAYNEKKEYVKSDNAFDRALAIAPNNPLVLNNYSYYLSLREEKLELAEKCIKRCIAVEPNSSTYLDTYGWVLYKLGRVDEAIIMIERAMKNGGNDNPEIIEHMCELLIIAGRIDEAYHICKYSIELNNSKETVEQKIESVKKQNEK
ncbi:MAG: tetratricopeptide repeat protein [Bacteroidales bacterium]|jgi:tetratricopeptide (TPR) repeat protein|nr:tetratricopeptide repeat protein [Bacteroidales bacterium]